MASEDDSSSPNDKVTLCNQIWSQHLELAVLKLQIGDDLTEVISVDSWVTRLTKLEIDLPKDEIRNLFDYMVYGHIPIPVKNFQQLKLVNMEVMNHGLVIKAQILILI